MGGERLPDVSTVEGELKVFHHFTAERLDWIFASILGIAWLVEVTVVWFGQGGEFSDRFQTVFFLSALLVCIPVALVIVRPGLQWNQALIGGAWASLALLGAWSVLTPGTTGWMARVWIGFLPVAMLSFYPHPRASWTAASVFVLADFSRLVGWTPSPEPFQPYFWLGHAIWITVVAGSLSLMNRSRSRSLVELLERQFRRAIPTEDNVTGLPLQTEGLALLRRCLAANASGGQIVGVIAIDIDQLKHINETLGMDAGDAVLRQAAKRFLTCLRGSDFLFRSGRDEFLAIFPNLADVVQAESMARRLLECMQNPFSHCDRAVFATASFGLAVSPTHGSDTESLVRSAELAVGAAQRSGRGSFRVFDPGLAPARPSREGLEMDLHQVLERGDLQLHYQPQVNASGRIVCVEALLRWRHPRHGFISPAEFIPLAEASGLILPIGEWVLGEACRQGAQWIRSGLPPIRMAVNVSPVQFARAQFVEQVALALAASGFDACLLELEITETLLMLDREDACDKISRLQALGVQVSIDDFGMGYSSLAYLQQLPVNALKIDRNFVALLDTSASALPLLAAIIMLAHSLNLEVVVEGVETDSQRETVWSLGADKAQGYFFARPQAANDITKLLRASGQLAAA